MSILPNLEKNAYLVIYIKDFYISANLIYSDFQISRYYILSSTLEHIRIEQLLDSSFWKEYLETLEKDLSWEIIHKGLGGLIHFGGEGVGVRGVEFVIDNRYFKSRVSDIVSAIRGYILDANIRFIENNNIKEILQGVNKKMEYDDIMLLDMNLKNFNIYRYQKNTHGGILTQKREDSLFNHGHINIGTFNGVVDRVFDSSFRAFASIPITSEKFVNDWANYVNNYGLYLPNKRIQDIIRSYILASTLTIRNDNNDIFDHFGDTKKKSLLLLTGSLVNNIDYKLMMLSLIDGLEIVGDVDVAFDKENRMIPMANNYLFGTLQSNYIVGKSDLLDRVIKTIIPTEIKGHRTRKVLGDINIDSISFGNQKYFAMNDQITYLNLPHESYVLNLRLKEDTTIYGEERYEYITSKKDINYSQLLVDCRVRPIVYGPSDKENVIKINSWINEEGTKINT